VRDLNHTYRHHDALHEGDFAPEGFEWIDANDAPNSVLSYVRKCRTPADDIVVVCNCTPMPRESYRIGVPHGGRWREVLNSDAEHYGGSGVGNLGGVEALPEGFHGRPHSIELTLPPLGFIMLQAEK
jgi:1,4-alpha-glucan branching enzyme